jgi:hypothetical protein
MLKRLVLFTFFLALLGLATVGLYTLNQKSVLPTQATAQFPWLEAPLKWGITTGGTLLTLKEELIRFSQSPELSTSLRITGQTAESLKNDIGKTLFPDAKTQAVRKSAEKQLRSVQSNLDAKMTQAKKLQIEIAELQQKQKSLDLTVNPLKKYTPDLTGFNMLQWHKAEPEQKGPGVHMTLPSE